MRAEYNIDEFLDTNEANSEQDEVEKKVSLLYDFCILHKRRAQQPDKREEAVRNFLRSYGSEILMDNALHDILVGKSELNDILKRKGFLQY